MRQQFFILSMMLLGAGASAQNVGVGTASPPSKLTVVGDQGSPSIPGPTSTGIFRVGVGEFNNEGIDFGKLLNSPFSGWMQVGFNGSIMDPLSLQPLGGSVGMGTIQPHVSAALDVTSTTMGFLPPCMTKAQRDAIATPAEGLVISCTDCSMKGLHQYINGSWQPIMSGSAGNYETVVNPATGKIWLDRNLGATQVSSSSSDAASYGDLYQWGRNADGHQIRTSGTTITLATSYFTTTGLFITTNTNPYNWLSVVETHMWSGTSAENNPCPSGFRVPTAAEWNQERLTWVSNNAAGAIASQLKLPMAGTREFINGSVNNEGSNGFYWSSTAQASGAWSLIFSSDNSYMDSNYRALGFSVRCLKD